MRKAMVLALVFMLMGCASAKLGDTAVEACDLYRAVRPDVVAFKAYATANWDSIPPDQQTILLDLNQYLPALDNAGQVVCAFAAGGGGVKIEWDEVLSVVLKAVGTAVQLQAKGVI